MRPALTTLVAAALLGSAPAPAQVTTLQSLSAGGSPGNAESTGATMTPDGRYVAFASKATNLVPGDTNASKDVFVRDRQTGQVELVSRSSAGALGNADSGPSALGFGHVAISGDGRHVAFASKASNLVPGDTNGKWDVFVRDRQTGQTLRISQPAGGGNANGDSGFLGGQAWMSADGRLVAFDSDATNLIGTAPGVTHIYLWDRLTGGLTGVSASVNGIPGDASSSSPSLSGDGRFVAFASYASNLLAGAPPPFQQVYVRDMLTGVVHPVSVSSAGTWGQAQSYAGQISRDARYVVFTSLAANLVTGDTNAARDVFVRDFWTLSTTRASVSPSGIQGNSDSTAGAISEFGRHVVFRTHATNLLIGFGGIDGHEDVLRKDLLTGLVEPVTISTSGKQANGPTHDMALSPDGRWCALVSEATDLVPGGTAALRHVFLREMEPCPTVVDYCVGKPNSAGCTPQVGFLGTPSLGDGQPLLVLGAGVVNKSLGILAYGKSGAALIPFAGGFLCVAPPILRTPVVQTGGNPSGNDCSGLLVIDFEAFAKSGADPQLIAGAVVHGQWWYRDPPASFGVGLSNAIRFQLCP